MTLQYSGIAGDGSVSHAFSFLKFVGNDFNTTDPTRVDEERWYAPFFPIHNVSIPEIGEEVLKMKEIGREDANKHQIYIKFTCTPSETI